MSIKSYNSLDEAIKNSFGQNVKIETTIRGARSDINTTDILNLSNNKKVFLKSNSYGNSSFFDAEAEGIEAIAKTNTIATPKLYCKGTDKKLNISFLIMEIIEQGGRSNDAFSELGSSFAKMHLANAEDFVSGGRYGFLHDNYIGATPQINSPKDTWIDFYRECRLEPQFRMAGDGVKHILKNIHKLLDRLDDLLIEPDKPALLHGDMWGGNHLFNKEGIPVLIDPAAYVGHSEADLAMTEMFSPFPRAFYHSYFEVIPCDTGYQDRKAIYNLYHYLNHYN
nr:fructosamine kinase family protein [Lachnospiraceae bacterium]